MDRGHVAVLILFFSLSVRFKLDRGSDDQPISPSSASDFSLCPKNLSSSLFVAFSSPFHDLRCLFPPSKNNGRTSRSSKND
ncbi:hypothetical protein BDN67DRAFT_963255 [Paxillus ammoniavirescens]|nr:hypothetical protein BDN67DRAFT_963255 [Paxillus ammoniavirescens]